MAGDNVDAAGINEMEGVNAVIVRSREAVFRGKAVVDGDDDGWDLSSEATTDDVVGLIVGREESESAAVEEDDDREIPAAAGIGGEKEADPEVANRIDHEVKGSDAADRGGVRGGAEIDERDESAIYGAV